MNYGIVAKVLGNLLALEAAMMVPSLLISFYYQQHDTTAFCLSILLTGIVGLLLSKLTPGQQKIKAKEGLAIVAWGWLLVSLFGALPFVFSGSVPSLADAIFETISGFTTTGATVIADVEALPLGLLFWRSFTHWMGGMGILVFTVALLPTLGVGGFQIFKAESPGPVAGKIAPRIKDTAKILYITYIAITLLEIVLLCLGGMSLFEAAVHTFGTVGTGGFSTRNASVGAFPSTFVHLVITVFMILSGVNFSLYFAAYQGKWKQALHNEELRLYLGIIAVATILIGCNIAGNYQHLGLALKDAFFQVGSIITTTGYSTVDFDAWPTFSKAILFLLMFVGGCAGSTAGGMKSIRILALLKLIKREVAKIFHPRAYLPVKVDKKVLADDTITSITSFFALYVIVFVLGTIVVSLEGVDLETAASSVAATLGNIGPGLRLVGPTQTFGFYSSASKLLLSVFMLLGRLELFTIVALLSPRAWRNTTV